MASKRYQENLALAKDPNVAAFLDALAAMEGTKGYNSGFSNQGFDMSKGHPNIRHKFKQTDGKTNSTTAAGRYQFLKGTWSNLEKMIPELKGNMSPANQDVGAVELIRGKSGALEAIRAGDFDKGLRLTGGTWASSPYSTHKQPKRTRAFYQGALNASLVSRGLKPVSFAGASSSGGTAAGEGVLGHGGAGAAPSLGSSGGGIVPGGSVDPGGGSSIPRGGGGGLIKNLNPELKMLLSGAEDNPDSSPYAKALADALDEGQGPLSAMGTAETKASALMAQIQGVPQPNLELTPVEPATVQDLNALSRTENAAQDLARQQDEALSFLLGQPQRTEQEFQIPSAVDSFLEQKLTTG